MIAIAIFCGAAAAGAIHSSGISCAARADGARAARGPLRRSPQPKTVSVVIAAHNGERFLAAKLDSVLALDYPRELIEILVVSDGSTDRTDDIVREYAPRGACACCAWSAAASVRR